MFFINESHRIVCNPGKFNIWLTASNLCFSCDRFVFGAIYINTTQVVEKQALVEKKWMKTLLRILLYVPDLFGNMFLYFAFKKDPKLEKAHKEIINSEFMSANLKDHNKIRGIFYDQMSNDLQLVQHLMSSDNPSLSIDMLPVKRQCSIVYHPKYVEGLKQNKILCDNFNDLIRKQIQAENHDGLVFALSQSQPSVGIGFEEDSGPRMDSILDLKWMFEAKHEQLLKKLLDKEQDPNSAINKLMERYVSSANIPPIYAVESTAIAMSNEIKSCIYRRMKTYMEKNPDYLKKYFKENSKPLTWRRVAQSQKLNQGAQSFIDSFFECSLRNNSDPNVILSKFNFIFETNLSWLIDLEETELKRILPGVAAGDNHNNLPFAHSINALGIENLSKISEPLNRFFASCLESESFSNAFFKNPNFCLRWNWKRALKIVFENEHSIIEKILNVLCEKTTWGMNKNLECLAFRLSKLAYTDIDFSSIGKYPYLLCYLIPRINELDFTPPLSLEKQKQLNELINAVRDKPIVIFDLDFAPILGKKILDLCNRLLQIFPINKRQMRDELFQTDEPVICRLRSWLPKEWREAGYRYLHDYLKLPSNYEDAKSWWIATRISREIFARLLQDDSFIDSLDDFNFMRLIFFLAIGDHDYPIEYLLLSDTDYTNLHPELPEFKFPPLKKFLNRNTKSANNVPRLT